LGHNVYIFSLSSDYLAKILQKFIANDNSIRRLFSRQTEINLKKHFSGYDNVSSTSELKVYSFYHSLVNKDEYIVVENLHFACQCMVACVFALLFSRFAVFNF